MAKRAVVRDTTQIDSIFFKPEDVRDLVYADEESVSSGDLVDSSELGEVVDDTDNNQNALPVLSSINIVSQTVRKNYMGDDVIDVVIEVEDFDEVKKWNVRIAELGPAV